MSRPSCSRNKFKHTFTFRLTRESHRGRPSASHVTDLKEKTKAELHPPQGKVNSLFSFSLRHGTNHLEYSDEHCLDLASSLVQNGCG